MKIEHELSVSAVCPKDGKRDRYRCTVRTDVIIPVEDILAAAGRFESREVYQEELCQLLHREINACVTLSGYHSGVRTVVTCGEAPR